MSATTTITRTVICTQIDNLPQSRRVRHSDDYWPIRTREGSADILHALHNASKLLDSDIKYQMTDPAHKAVQFINHLLERAK